MSSSPSSPEPISAAQMAALEQQLAALTAERDRLARERDEYKSRAEWLHQQLERLKYDAKTPRERVDPRQIQLVFEPFAQALLGPAASDASAEPASSQGGGRQGAKPRKTTPHGRRILPEHLPLETVVLTPSPLPEDAIQIGNEISWRLGYRRASYYRLRVVRPLFAVSKEAAETITEVTARRLLDTEPSRPSGSPGQPTSPAAAPSEPNAPSAPRAPDVAPTEAIAPPAPAPPDESTTAAACRGGSSSSALASGVAGSNERAATKAASQEQDSPGRDALAGDLLDRTIVVAPAPDEIIPRGLPAPDLLAHVLVGKFADKLPFNRQEGISAREGVPITRGTMCGWAEAAHNSARLVVEAMVADAREHAHVIATDATGVLVQANDKCKRGHFWVYVADRDHVIFRYTPVHSNDEPKAFFRAS